MTGSGIDPETGKWSPEFPGQRPPARERNALAVTHGSYAVLALTPRAEAIADWIRQAASHLTPSDEAGVKLLALTLAQLERAGGALGEVDEAIQRGDDVDAYLGRMESRARLSRDARAWTEAARKMLHELGLTPAGRAELEDRTLTVVHVHEVAEFVPNSRRAAFLSALDEALRSTMPDVVLELPAVEIPPAQEDGSG